MNRYAVRTDWSGLFEPAAAFDDLVGLVDGLGLLGGVTLADGYST